MKLILRAALKDYLDKDYYEFALNDQDFQTIKIQLKAYGLIDLNFSCTTKGSTALFWNLTEQGEALMLKLRAIQKGAKQSQTATTA